VTAPASARASVRRSRGFTLIEVIVAISLLGFGLALVFGTLRGASKATERAESVAQRDERLRAVQGLLRRQIGAAMPVAFVFDAESGSATFLRASDSKLEFVSTMPGYLARGGPYLQTLEFVRGEDGQQLRFQHQLLSADGALDAEREPVALLEGIAEASFAMRGLDGRGRPGAWLPSWEASAQLPPLVRLQVRFVDASRRWPEFIVAPRLSPAFAGAAGEPLAPDFRRRR
jgi:general secretion pathway protein J